MAIASPVFRMADRLVDGNLAQIIVGYHNAGHSHEHISRLLWAEHGVDVSGQTLRRWVPILVAENEAVA